MQSVLNTWRSHHWDSLDPVDMFYNLLLLLRVTMSSDVCCCVGKAIYVCIDPTCVAVVNAALPVLLTKYTETTQVGPAVVTSLLISTCTKLEWMRRASSGVRLSSDWLAGGSDVVICSEGCPSTEDSWSCARNLEGDEEVLRFTWW